MRFASLGSGSGEHALLIECGPAHARRRILIDCGFGLREATRRLERLSVAPVQIDAIFVTHEHGDHIGGAARLAVAAGATLYMTAGTAVAGLGRRAPSPEAWSCSMPTSRSSCAECGSNRWRCPMTHANRCSS